MSTRKVSGRGCGGRTPLGPGIRAAHNALSPRRHAASTADGSDRRTSRPGFDWSAPGPRGYTLGAAGSPGALLRGVAGAGVHKAPAAIQSEAMREMADTTAFMEAVAAAMLDGMTLSFVPIDVEGTHLPTEFVVSVRHDVDGRTYGNSARVGFSELVMSGMPDEVLAEAISSAMAPVADAAIEDREHAVA